uniref:Uncharacterized protein n=1 Tax=Candidatus Kentrum sp. MB TaxID=2138164 RepID=A0A451B8S6_9GAMM|nr:MAG: hypothetical protein BECKMB1821G_GA0114241_101320 [Candidatus Kentron sp. MB]VFK29152.1 MAG: hypothetical protein BECKMB1821I_GA0114274_100856 [Candidatus Kentron sp. MB]VFK74696.1 MAG: hypothetical protein BECKMB1821H_GA0114242_100855 [Candidatus Kentron sp. MB]
MTNAKTWVLDDSPIPKNEIEATLELYSEEQTMGIGGTRKTIESKVTFGKQKFYALRERDKRPSNPMAEPNPSGSSYYLVEIPFTLHPPAGKRDYEKFTIKIDLATDGATAFRMFPYSVVTRKDVEKGLDLSAKLSIKGIGVGADGSYIVRFPHIYPLVTAFGVGEQNFYWNFERQEGSGSPLLPGSRRTLILLEVMQGTKLVTGILHAKATIKDSIPFFGSQNIIADDYPIEWNLKNAGTLDDIPWKD